MRRSSAEAYLDKQRVDYHFVAHVPIGRINVEASLINQARPLAKHKDLVERYRRFYVVNPDPPAIVAYEGPGGRLIVIDGNHRVLAVIEAGGTEIDVYIVQCADMSVIRRMTRQINRWMEGLQQTDPEALANALFDVDQQTMTEARAADEYGVPLAEIQKHTRLARARKKLAAAGIAFEKLPETDQITISEGCDNFNTMKMVADLAITTPLYTEEVRELVRLVKAALKTEESQGQAVLAYMNAHPEFIDRGPKLGGMAPQHGEKIGVKAPVKRPPHVSKPKIPVYGFIRDLESALDKANQFPTCQRMGLTGPNEMAKLRGIMSGLTTRMAGFQNTFGRTDDAS